MLVQSPYKKDMLVYNRRSLQPVSKCGDSHAKSTNNHTPCTQSATYPGPERVAGGRMRGVNERVEKQFAETQPIEMLKFGDAWRHDDSRRRNSCTSKKNVSVARSG